MSTVIFNESTSVTLRTDIIDGHKDNAASRTREFRVLSAVGLHAYQLVEFAETLRELGALEARNVRISATTDPGKGLTRLTAEWKVDLPAEAE